MYFVFVFCPLSAICLAGALQSENSYSGAKYVTVCFWPNFLSLREALKKSKDFFRGGIGSELFSEVEFVHPVSAGGSVKFLPAV